MLLRVWQYRHCHCITQNLFLLILEAMELISAREITIQPVFNGLKLTTETLEQDVKYFQS